MFHTNMLLVLPFLILNAQIAYSKFKTLQADEIEGYTKKQDLTFVLIFESTIKPQLEVWEGMSDVFDGFARFVAVESGPKLPKTLKSSKYPAVKAVSAKSTIDFRGTISPHSLYRFGIDQISAILKKRFDAKGFTVPETYVITLDESNFTQTIQNSADHYLVEFYAPWCGHCKNLAPHWKEAAEKLHGKMKLAAVDCTANEGLASKFGIRGFPTIKFIPAKSADIFSPLEYDGGRTAADIVSWAENRIGSMLPPPTLTQATSQEVLQDECFSKGICIISFLPNRLDSDAKTWKKYIKEVEDAMLAYQKSGFGWVWMEGAVEEKFEEAMGVGGFGYPAMVALSHKKKAFSIMKSSFDGPSIKTFLGNLGSKAAAPQPLTREIPTIKETKEWDGSEFAKSDL